MWRSDRIEKFKMGTQGAFGSMSSNLIQHGGWSKKVSEFCFKIVTYNFLWSLITIMTLDFQNDGSNMADDFFLNAIGYDEQY